MNCGDPRHVGRSTPHSRSSFKTEFYYQTDYGATPVRFSSSRESKDVQALRTSDSRGLLVTLAAPPGTPETDSPGCVQHGSRREEAARPGAFVSESRAPHVSSALSVGARDRPASVRPYSKRGGWSRYWRRHMTARACRRRSRSANRSRGMPVCRCIWLNRHVPVLISYRTRSVHRSPRMHKAPSRAALLGLSSHSVTATISVV